MRKKQDPFVEIRPYNTEEIPYAINRMLMSSNFVTSLTNFIETSNPSTLVRRMRKMKTISDLQREIYAPMVHTFEQRSTPMTVLLGVSAALQLLLEYLLISNMWEKRD